MWGWELASERVYVWVRGKKKDRGSLWKWYLVLHVHVLYSVIVWFLIERSQGTILLHFYIFNPRQIGMLNFYPFTLANSHVMLLLTAAKTHGITEDPQEKKLSFFRVCLWLAFVSSWCYQPVSAHDQDKRSQKANQLVSLCSLSNFYNTFFIQYLCRAQFCTKFVFRPFRCLSYF